MEKYSDGHTSTSAGAVLRGMGMPIDVVLGELFKAGHKHEEQIKNGKETM